MTTGHALNDYSSNFRVANWQVKPLASEIELDGQRQRLEPKVMAVLICLAEQAGNVVTRQDIEARVWANRVVGYDALSSAIIKLRKAFGEDSRQPAVIETIAKRGYRIIAEVEFQQRHPASTQAQPSKPQPSPDNTTAANRHSAPPLKIIWGSIALFSVLLIALAAGLKQYWIDKPAESVERSAQNMLKIDRTAPSIAVLAFKNMSNNPQQDYLSDGIAADLITGLSKVPGLSVIARHSSFAYKDTLTDIRIIGEQLGARYILEGSVRRSAQSIRISVRLVDPVSGFNLWADSFSGPIDNVFSFQDNVTSSIVSVLKIKLSPDEQDKLKYAYTHNIEAYDNFLRGWQHMWRFTRDENKSAREYLLKAIELDPEFARAYANLAVNYIFDFNHRWSKDQAQTLQRAKELAATSVRLDPALAQAYMARGYTELYAQQFNRAIISMQQGISLNPSFADAYVLLAMALNFSGDAPSAQKIMQTAMLLNPRYTALYNIVSGQIEFNLRNYPQAINYFNQALEHNPGSNKVRLWLAAAYAYAGHISEASWELEEARSAKINVSIKQLRRVIPLRDPAQKQHFIDGLIIAGLPKEQDEKSDKKTDEKQAQRQ